MMYAIVKNGGKQYRVSEGETVEFEKVLVEAGGNIEFDQVLMVVNGEEIKIGAPLVAKAKVVGEVVKHGRQEKVNVLKFRRRKHHMKRIGHRQHYTAIKITKIES